MDKIIITRDLIGKKAVFKLHKCNWIPRKETRIIHGIIPNKGIYVTHNGCNKSFIVWKDEIIKIID